jgi:glycosyltransferase involved in cell wall biosynthesis
MSPKVSVLIPCFNHAHYLGYALESVISQTYVSWEAIVIDDGSTDNTPQVAAQFDDLRIRYIFQENQGLSAARNTGIRAANSKIIALLDADDIWREDYLEKMMASLFSHPEAVAAYCGYQYIDQNGNKVGIPNITVVPPEEFREYYLNVGNWLIPSGVIFRKSFAEIEGYFDESLQAVEDAFLWSKLSRHGPFVGVPSSLVGYRRHESNMSSDPQRMVSSNYKIIERIYGPPQGNPSTWTERKQRSYTRYFRLASIRYLTFGDIRKSSHYFRRMQELAPQAGCEIGIWRSLARAHMPIEIRNAPAIRELESAEKDVLALLAELSEMRSDSIILANSYSIITGIAFLSLAEEAFRARKFRQAYSWLWKASRNHSGLLISRPYWGTLARGITGVN